MRSSIFVFLGFTESGSNADIKIFQERLKLVLPTSFQQIRFAEKGDLLIIALNDQSLRFYISFANNDYRTRNEWKELAKNFELPWDLKPVDILRLTNIYACLEEKGWSEYGASQTLGFVILEEMEKFKKVKVFTIPSIEKSLLLKRFLKMG